MFKTGLAALAALCLAAPASAATISSGTAFFEQSVSVPNSRFITTPTGVDRTLTASVNVAQFDPVFGVLDRIDLVFDITSAMQLLAYNNGSPIPFFYGSDLTMDIGDTTTLIMDYDYQTYAPGIPNYFPIAGFNRDLVRVSLTESVALAMFTGTGTAAFDLTARQFFGPSQGAQVIGYDQPMAEQVSAINVEYSFTPGVQTVQTQDGLLAFSSAFVPEVILEREGLTVVPLPAAVWMLLAGLGGLGAIARRKD